MARIERKPTGNAVSQRAGASDKEALPKSAVAGAVVAALIVFGLAGYFLTRPSTQGTVTPTLTPGAGVPAQSGGRQNVVNSGPVLIDGVPSAMRGMPGVKPQSSSANVATNAR